MKKSDLTAEAKPRVPDTTVRRLSLYLRYVQEAHGRGQETISSAELARRGGTTSAQVRKDFSFFGSFGKRGLGYAVPELLRELEEILGLHRRWRVALVGAGKIGSALFGYDNFQRRGFDIVAVFDADPSKVGQPWGDIRVQHDAEMERVLQEEAIEIAVLAVPVEAAQSVADRVTASGVRAILNFAPIRLRVDERVALRNVDMVAEMEGLTFSLTAGDR